MLWHFFVFLLSFAFFTLCGLFSNFLLSFSAILLAFLFLFLLGSLLLFSLDGFHLCLQLLFEVVLDGLERVLQLVEGGLLEFDRLIVFQQLTA